MEFEFESLDVAEINLEDLDDVVGGVYSCMP